MVISPAKNISLSACFVLAATAVSAQSLDDTCRATLSEHPITVIVGNSPGGGYDTYARAFAPFLGEVIGTDVRVANMPGGGGLLAATAIAQQDEDELLILLEDLSDLLNQAYSGSSPFSVTDYTPLGTMLSEPRVWFGRPDLDLSQPLVAGAPTLESSAIDTSMVAYSAGIDVEIIAGYDGSSEQAAAVLRGEIDFHAPSLGTALRNAAGNDLDVVLVIADEPSPRVPDVPTLGDIVRAAGDAGDMEIAQIAMNLTFHHRALVTAGSVQGERLDCLRAATDIALTLPEFAEAAQAQGRFVDPLMHEDAIVVFEALAQSWEGFEAAAERVAQ